MDIYDQLFDRFVENCGAAMLGLYDLEVILDVQEKLRREFEHKKKEYADRGEPLPDSDTIQREVSRAVLAELIEDEPITGGEISNTLLTMQIMKKVHETDERKNGERGNGQVLEFKKLR